MLAALQRLEVFANVKQISEVTFGVEDCPSVGRQGMNAISWMCIGQNRYNDDRERRIEVQDPA